MTSAGTASPRGAAVRSLDATVATACHAIDDADGVGPLFDWYGNGDVSR